MGVSGLKRRRLQVLFQKTDQGLTRRNQETASRRLVVRKTEPNTGTQAGEKNSKMEIQVILRPNLVTRRVEIKRFSYLPPISWDVGYQTHERKRFLLKFRIERINGCSGHRQSIKTSCEPSGHGPSIAISICGPGQPSTPPSRRRST